MSKSDYYKGGKCVSIGGAPCKVAAWVGELGNDAEFKEATKPRGFKGAYYEGGERYVIGGVPIRVAAHVKGWRPATKAFLGKGAETAKETAALDDQLGVLFPSYVPKKFQNSYCCVDCRTELKAWDKGKAEDCWHCRQTQRIAA